MSSAISAYWLIMTKLMRNIQIQMKSIMKQPSNQSIKQSINQINEYLQKIMNDEILTQIFHQMVSHLTNKTKAINYYYTQYLITQLQNKQAISNYCLCLSKDNKYNPKQMLQTHIKTKTYGKTFTNIKSVLTKSQSQRMHNYIRINSQNKRESTHQWRPLISRQSKYNRSVSENRLTYSGKKAVLKSLGKNTDNLARTQDNSNSKSIATLLKSKINFGQLRLSQQKQSQKISHKNNYQQKKRFIEIPSEQRNILLQSKMSRFSQKISVFGQTQKNPNQQTGIQKKHLLTTLLSSQNVNILYIIEPSETLQEKILSANSFNKRIITVFTIRRYGLRMRINYGYLTVCRCHNQSHKEHSFEYNKDSQEMLEKMLPNNGSTKFYYFQLNQQPLTYTHQLSDNTYSIIASNCPKLNIDSEFHIKLFQESEKADNRIRDLQQQLQINNKNQVQYNRTQPIQKRQLSNDISQQEDEFNQGVDQTKYDWQIINNIDDYVERVCENPQLISIKDGSQSNLNTPIKSRIKTWYNQKWTEPQARENAAQSKKEQKNPLLENLSHYPSQIKNKDLLHKISSLIAQNPRTRNTHQIKKKPIENMVEKVNRQTDISRSKMIFENSKSKLLMDNSKQLQKQPVPNIINRNIESVLQQKKSILQKLDRKHSLLSQQNIPYLMEKYGVNRFEVHNLYNLYKTLQKISAMRLRDKNHNHLKVVEKGIDRSTFDEGMKRLDINPGEQVIKNICFFDDFISWEQFIKIISIGMRKTPEQKLQAILVGIGGANDGILTKKQISVMIGSSLSKIFDSDEPQLKAYFTEVAMNDLDDDGNGFIEINEIKKKVLSLDPENMDLVSFLLLNS